MRHLGVFFQHYWRKEHLIFIFESSLPKISPAAFLAADEGAAGDLFEREGLGCGQALAGGLRDILHEYYCCFERLSVSSEPSATPIEDL